jgi:radical SAM protein with 4Fe4S-binding SPASM domain
VFLLYAPLHHLSAVINRSALNEIRCDLQSGKSAAGALEPIVSGLSGPSGPIPQARSGDLNDPYFLGLLPTRGCSMACRYCDFLSGSTRVMSPDTVRWSVDAYLDLLHQQRRSSGAVHFFGGEPFHAPQVVQLAVEYARIHAADLGIELHFEATTNGCYDPTLARWIADNLDTVVLSLDGTAEIQDAHRTLPGGASSFDRVTASAAIFAEGDCELVIRACVSNRSVDALPEIAGWFSGSFHPSTICFEPLSESNSALRHHLLPPDPLTYARKFCAAADLLEKAGIPTVLSTADLSQNRVTACPVGNDALIVSPEGNIYACYLLEKEWQAAGLDMTLGKVAPDGFRIDPAALERVRRFSVHQKPLCADCFCRFHCAGGCHVHHNTHLPPGCYDDLCIRTRLVTAALLLDGLGQRQLREVWLADDRLVSQTAWQVSDRLLLPGGSE